MELIRAAEPLKFNYKDVTFFIKPYAVEADRLEVWGSGEAANGKLSAPRAAFIKALIRCFVVDWIGVTENGKPVPYSYETFVERFPKQRKDEAPIFIALGNFIVEHTDITKQNESEKKTSSPQPIGSPA